MNAAEMIEYQRNSLALKPDTMCDPHQRQMRRTDDAQIGAGPGLAR